MGEIEVHWKNSIWLLMAAMITIFDQVTKYLIWKELGYSESIAVFPFLNFKLAFNQGAAFSFLSSGGGHTNYLIATIALCVGGFIIYCILTSLERSVAENSGLMLLLGGAFGNLIDRLYKGYVVDFIDFHLQGWHFATFNVADTAITFGVLLLIYNLMTAKQS